MQIENTVFNHRSAGGLGPLEHQPITTNIIPMIVLLKLFE
jgi:hypothetical protein